MTTEAPLTRRQIRERERAQFETLAAKVSSLAVPTAGPAPVSPITPSRQYFDSSPVVLVPPHVLDPVIEVVAPAEVLAPEPLAAPEAVAQPVTELPVPDAAAPWPEWASRAVALNPQLSVPDAFESVQPVADDLVAEVPEALVPEAFAPDAEPPAPVELELPAAPPVSHATRPRVPLAPRTAPTPVPVPRKPASVRRPVAATAPRKAIGRRVLSKVFSGAALLFAGALLVGSSIPANAFMQSTLGVNGESFEQAAAGQTMSVSDVPLALDGSVRDAKYKVVSPEEELVDQYGIASGAYSPTTGPVRWPFPYSVPTSDGFGPRVSPCAGCSTFHNGLDFLPGNGKPIYAVAAGVVTFHAMDGSLGNKVEIAHVIKGQAVESVYAHMQLNSSPLKVGDKIKAGDFIGLVGATGTATAPHLHLEIHLAGVPVNPYTWLTANAS